ncbi:MAG: hypothetical protein E7554_04720 [Ruminococcaceae bacterium]|nr:hypothetical protein [Oscillospiraceae bacterium]
MNLDKFSRKRRTEGSSAAGAPEYDFSQIAQEAVSDMMEQQRQDASYRDDQPLDFSPRTFDDLPGSHQKDVFDGRRPRNDAPWDRPVDPSEISERGNAAPRRKAFSFGRAKLSEAPDSDFDDLQDFAGIEEPPRKERKSFDFGKGKARGSDSAQPEAWDQPRDRASIENPPQRERRFPGFGRKKPTDAPEGEQPRIIEATSPDAAEQPARRGFRKSGSAGSAPAAEVNTAPPSDYPEFTDSFDDDLAAPAPEVTAPVSSAPERRVFNAATQPNYSYMTDYPEEDQPALASQPEDTSPASGFLGSVKSTIQRKLNRDEPGVQYYTPPANRAPSDVRRRQKRRNRKPLAPWVKYALFGAGLAAVFVIILLTSFYLLITGRINYVGDSDRNSVYLTVEEYANLQADLTDTEENAAEFTEPLNILEPNENIKVIMLVSSDSRIGDVYNKDGRKITNQSAKTDSIMLIAIDNEHRRLRVASIMTDTYVRIQDYKTNKLSKAYYYDTANGDYTLPCLRQAVRDNFGVTPDNFVVVDFNAFQILVNRLGGINVEVTADEAYYMSSHKRYGDFPRFNSAGQYTMSGAEALNYVRMRAVGNDDYDRSARQRVVLNQILAKLRDMSDMELAELAYAMLPELPTDMTAGQLYDYFQNAADLASYEVNEVTFPITYSWRYGTATVRPEEDPAEAPPTTISNSDLAGSTPAPTLSKFTVIVTNFQFNSTVLQKFLYENDDSYLNGTVANGITVPEIIAPLEADSPVAPPEA